MKSSRRSFQGCLSAIALLAGCHASSQRNGAPETAAEPPEQTLRRAADAAREKRLPLFVVVYDPARDAGELVDYAASIVRAGGVSPLLHGDALIAIGAALSLSDSRSRAAAAPLHAVDAPTLVLRSPGGVGLSRDEGELSIAMLNDRVTRAATQMSAEDATFARLSAAVEERPAEVARRVALADYLLAHDNARLAIPHLRLVADDAGAHVAVRVHAWTAMARAHLWMIEPEKARYASQALIDQLGPTTPLAIAGGNLVRGLQDTRAKRFGRARDELNAAVAAAPDSEYGREAAALLLKLPAATTNAGPR